DGRTVALHDGTTTLWDLCTGKRLFRLGKPFSPQSSECSLLDFSPDRKLLATVEEKAVVVYAVSNGRCLLRTKQSEDKLIALSFSPDSKTLLIFEKREDLSCLLRQLVIAENRELPSPPIKDQYLVRDCSRICFSQDRQTYASSTLDQQLVCCN